MVFRFAITATTCMLIDRPPYFVFLLSDQMVWPEAITSSINFLIALNFLTKEEKEMILYKNAKRFLNIKDGK
jgi:hypothetical protein